MSRVLSYFRPVTKSAVAESNGVPKIVAIELTKPSIGSRTSPAASNGEARQGHPFPQGDFRNAPLEDIHNVKYEVMVNWLHTQQEERQWLSGDEEEGVVLKKSKGDYAFAPANLKAEASMLIDVVSQLNVRVSGCI